MNPALQAAIEADNWPGPWSDEFLDGLTRLVIEGGRLELDRCFPGVTSMLLDGVHIPSLGVLAQLPALTELCLAACQVDDWTWPSELRLEELDLSNVRVSPEQLGRHPAMRQLSILCVSQPPELDAWLRSLGSPEDKPSSTTITVERSPEQLPALATVKLSSPFVTRICDAFMPAPVGVHWSGSSSSWSIWLGSECLRGLSEEELLERVADKEGTLAELRELGAPVPPPPDPFLVEQSWEEARSRVLQAEGLAPACREGMLRLLDRFPGQAMVRVPAERLPMLSERARLAFDTLSGPHRASSLLRLRRSSEDIFGFPCSGTEDPTMRALHDSAQLYQFGVSMRGTCLLVEKDSGRIHAVHLDDMGELEHTLGQTRVADSLGELLGQVHELNRY